MLGNETSTEHVSDPAVPWVPMDLGQVGFEQRQNVRKRMAE